MKYFDAQRRGYPIGTGVTEAAAKTVVGTRMKRAGARFSRHGGQTIMLFRTSILSPPEVRASGADVHDDSSGQRAPTGSMPVTGRANGRSIANAP